MQTSVEPATLRAMTACSKHPGTQAGAQLRELLAECERLLKQVEQIEHAEVDQFALVDELAKDIESDTVQQASEALLALRLAVKRSVD
jgi:hypothetical protein